NLTAVRYHSLAVAEPLPHTLQATARAEDGVLMGLAHRDQPRWGLQFHPESVASQGGHTLITNFAALARPRATGAAHHPPPSHHPSGHRTARGRRPDRPGPPRPAPLAPAVPPRIRGQPGRPHPDHQLRRPGPPPRHRRRTHPHPRTSPPTPNPHPARTPIPGP